MAYNELIKNFNRIRDYMREFYVYGFKSRDEYSKKSRRSYDNERRRMESIMGDFMQFRQTADSKNVFLSIDSRVNSHNPLYNAWKAKSFTDGDITLHFLLFDIMNTPEVSFSISELSEIIDERLSSFDEPVTFDISTIRKKLKEYTAEGLIQTEKIGKTVYYRRTADSGNINYDMLSFFSEAAPCGVVGSFLLDKQLAEKDHIAFKHHYITDAIDSEVVCDALKAMRQKKYITVEYITRRKDRTHQHHVVPLKYMSSTQSGRAYLLVYEPVFGVVCSYRVDNIVSVEEDEVCEEFDRYRKILDDMMPHLWGISVPSRPNNQLEHVEFTIQYEPHETHIPRRLEREKRIGTVEHLDNKTSRFSADVYDSSELVPWIRSYICRIVDISFSNKVLEKQFLDDIKSMYAMYDLEGGDSDGIQ